MSKATQASVDHKQRTLKQLNSKLQNEIMSRQSEIKKVQNHYNVEIENRKNLNENKLSEQREIHADKIKQAIDKKNDKTSKKSKKSYRS